MMRNHTVLLLLVAFVATACTNQIMEITILNTIKTEKIPSGSGITKAGDLYYIIGDDSPYLFALDKEFKPVSKTALFDSAYLQDERIIKEEKPDFEAMEMVGEKELVIFGSGSKSPQRNVFMRIMLEQPMQIEKYDISEFYDKLRNLDILKDSELNIEAAAFHKDHIFLFNRKKNILFKFEYNALLGYFRGEMPFPELESKQFSLPRITGIEAGFSGATALKEGDKIIFTASVENTDNAYDDGEILGSFIGMIDISGVHLSDTINSCQIPNAEENLKVESVTVEEEISSGKTKVVLITDDDRGNSIIIESILTW